MQSLPDEDPPTTGNQPASELKRSEEHTSELQSPCNLVCRLLLEKKKNALCTHIVVAPWPCAGCITGLSAAYSPSARGIAEPLVIDGNTPLTRCRIRVPKPS